MSHKRAFIVLVILALAVLVYAVLRFQGAPREAITEVPRSSRPT